MIGTRLGPYEVTAKLGEGGMGVVYKAKDFHLGRDVALKVLPDSFASDPERLARFEREAKLLAQLNHPNIAQIYGFEASGDTRALVMELVEGPTLAERLEQESLSFIESLSVSLQIAQALEEAHEKGIVHRDLKPQNIKASMEGRVKVLDFGLAKAFDPVSPVAMSPADLAHSPTLTLGGTREGVILGTAAYMAPEQARGGAVDKRADIWAFGVVLYEMLSGERLFGEGSVVDTLSAVMRKEIDLGKLPASTPPRLRELVRRCLERDPKRRLRDIGDARLELEAVRDGELGASGGAIAPPVRAVHGQAASGPGRFALVVAAILAAGIGGLLVGRKSAGPASAPAPARAIRASIELPPGAELDGVGSPVVALSRDGSTLAFLAREAGGHQRLYLRDLESGETRLVPGSDTAEGPFFSPDGRWVAFAVGVSMVAGGVPRELRKCSLETGLTQTISPIDDFFGGVWREDDTIVFLNLVDAGGIWSVPASGGPARPLVQEVKENGARTRATLGWPELLPGGRAVLITVDHRGTGLLAVLDLETGELVRLGVRGSSPRYLPTGHVAFGGAGAALEVLPFDAGARKVTGTPVATLADLAFTRWRSAVYDVAEDGTLVYTTGFVRRSRREPMRVVRASRDGRFEVLPIEPDLYGRALAVSPDGRRVALAREEGGAWIAEIARGTRTRSAGNDLVSASAVAWSARGDRLIWIADQDEDEPGARLLSQSGEGGGPLDPLTAVGPDLYLAGWTPDGSSVVFVRLIEASGSALERLPLGGRSETLWKDSGTVAGAALSPDGRIVALEIDSGEGFQIALLQLATGERVAVTASGGRQPAWSSDGRELYFRRSSSIYAAEVHPSAGGLPKVGTETKLFDWPEVYVWSPSPDGFFYGTEPVPGAAVQTRLQLRTGWFADVERLAGRGGNR